MMPQAKRLNTKHFCENFSSDADLRLSGAQMSLIERPRSSVARANARALHVGGIPRTRRPMSAVPHSEYPGGPRSKRRPYSADNQILTGNRPLRRDKNPRPRDDLYLDHSESEKDNNQVSSSTLLNSLMSDEPSGPWTDINEIPRPADMDANESLTNTSDLLCTFSDISEEPTSSEKSLGERICAMAQNSACDVTPTLPKSAVDDLEEENTRNLSNRELHFRMIAAGLISRPGSKNVEVEDVENNDGENKLNGRRTVTFGEESKEDGGRVEESKEDGGRVEESKDDGGRVEEDEESVRREVPVRFQQWMTSNNSSPAKGELFCSTQLYPFRRKKSDLFLECMVEEILDEEQEKLLNAGAECSWSPRLDRSNGQNKDVTISTWPTASDEAKEADRIKLIEQEDERESDNKNPGDPVQNDPSPALKSSSNKIVNPKTLISSTTTVQFNKSSGGTAFEQSSVGVSSDAAGPAPKTTSTGRTIRNSALISGRRTNVISSTKVCSSVAVATCRLSRTPKSRFSPSRRNSKGSSTLMVDEERFPEECASEMESWMSVKCSGDVMKTRGVEGQVVGSATEKDDSTFDEIFDLIKVLEEDEKSGSSVLPTNINKSAGGSTLSAGSESLHEGQPHEQSATLKKTHASSMDHDMKSILSYLDQVDESCDSAMTSERVSPSGTARSRSYNPGVNSSDSSERIDELLVMSHVDLAREVLSIRLSLEESTKTIELLRASLKEQREAQGRREKSHKSAMDKKIHEVKSECEAIVKRHQKFIDQLIADKAALSERCERLVSDGRQAEERHTKTVSEMEERHKIEIQRTKDIATATEKLRHERWVEKKTQKIKELTVRGLEPELNRMSSQHEQELSSLRTLHAQELEQAELRAARRTSQQLDALRQQMQQEQEEALTRERDQHRQRLEKIQQAEDDKLEEQRRLLVAEIRRERDRLAAHEVALEAQFEERKRVTERETERERERLRKEYIEKAEILHNTNQNEMTRLRDSLEAEKEAWIAASKQQQAQAVAQATTEVKEQLRKERDRELEAVIERLESEATQARLEKEQAAENRIRRLRDQFNKELQEAEAELASQQAKNTDLRASLQEREAALVAFEVQNRALQTELTETRKVAEHLSAERGDIKKALQKEIENDVDKLRTEIAELRAKLIQESAMFSEQMERERNVHQQELHNVYTRVRQAIEKKDDVVQTAKAKHRAAEDHIKHLEAMLQHQRRINNQALP